MECSMFFLLLLLPPISTLPVTLFPYTTHCRSGLASAHPVPRRNRGRSMAAFDDQTSPVAWGWVRLSTVRRGSVVISRPTGVTEKQSLEDRSEEHTSELQSLMRISYDVYCLNKEHQTKRK